MRYPRLGTIRTSREMIDTFKGYDCRERIGEGWFQDMTNLTSSHYPLMAPRGQRKVFEDIEDLPKVERPREGRITGVTFNEKWGVIYAQGENLYIWGSPNSAIGMGLGDEIKRFVQMGSYLIVLPDMAYLNLENLNDFGSLGHYVEVTEGTVTCELCDAEGNAYTDVLTADTAPEAPEDKALWIDTSGEDHVLKRYSATSGQWVTVVSTYVKISGLEGERGRDYFREYDGVTISGLKGAAAHLNGGAVLHYGSHRTIMIPGILDEVYTQDCAEAPVRVERKVPVLDYVVECGNRLWGCHYGKDRDGKMVNEIYASKLGDPRNWYCYMGISTDSWTASVGSGGSFTGAAVVGGHPVFYKYDRKHKVWPSDSGAHQITELLCQGVGVGCDDSVAMVDGKAVYKSNIGFCIDDGDMPVEIGQNFNQKPYGSACATVFDRKYYVSMIDEDDHWHLFVYDLDRKLWHREDDLHVLAFCGSYAVVDDGRKIIDLRGKGGLVGHGMEGPVRWMAQTGEFGLEMPNMKRLRKLILRLSMEIGAEMACYIRYDGDQEWTYLFTLLGSSLRSFSVPVRPRRCDHFQLRLEGVGDVKLWSITKIMDEGSDKS